MEEGDGTRQKRGIRLYWGFIVLRIATLVDYEEAESCTISFETKQQEIWLVQPAPPIVECREDKSMKRKHLNI